MINFALHNIIKLRNRQETYITPNRRINSASLKPLEHDTISLTGAKDRSCSMKDYEKELSIMLDGVEEPEYETVEKEDIPETFDEYGRTEVNYFDKAGVLRRQDTYYDGELYVTLYSKDKNKQYEAKMLIKSPEQDDSKWHYKCTKNWFNLSSPKKTFTHAEILKLDDKHKLINRKIYYNM